MPLNTQPLSDKFGVAVTMLLRKRGVAEGDELREHKKHEV
jgi:hypothetical protein